MSQRTSPHHTWNTYSQSIAAICLMLSTACSSDNGSGDRSLMALPFDADAMSTMLYECADAGENVYELQLFEGGDLRISDETGAFANGTWSLADEVITLGIPELDFEETAQSEELALGVLGVFITDSLYCHAVAFHGEASAFDEYYCPTSNHIPDVSFEEDELVLRENGNVFWRHWDYLVEANDQLYSAQNGIWKQEGDQVAMFFGSPFYDGGTLTGTLGDSTLFVDQFDTSNGPCEAMTR